MTATTSCQSVDEVFPETCAQPNERKVLVTLAPANSILSGDFRIQQTQCCLWLTIIVWWLLYVFFFIIFSGDSIFGNIWWQVLVNPVPANLLLTGKFSIVWWQVFVTVAYANSFFHLIGSWANSVYKSWCPSVIFVSVCMFVYPLLETLLSDALETSGQRAFR